MAAKLNFNLNDFGHRRLLAAAIDAFTSRPGNTISGTKQKGGKSLVEELRRAKTPVTRTQIDRLKKAPLPENSEQSYPDDAFQVVEYLHEERLFPPYQDPLAALEMLPIFFDGFGETAAHRLTEVKGRYICYQYSNVDPSYIVAGELTIGAPTELRCAPVREEVKIKHNGSKQLIFEGIAFSDPRRLVYMFLREKSLRHPRFYLFDDSDGPDDKVETLFGTILAGARQHHSHLSPVCLYRGDFPAPSSRIPRGKTSLLPEHVANYLARPLMPGHSNASNPVFRRF